MITQSINVFTLRSRGEQDLDINTSRNLQLLIRNVLSLVELDKHGISHMHKRPVSAVV